MKGKYGKSKFKLTEWRFKASSVTDGNAYLQKNTKDTKVFGISYVQANTLLQLPRWRYQNSRVPGLGKKINLGMSSVTPT